jgi:hypothetical protein
MACLAGYTWIFAIQAIRFSHTDEPEVCVFRYLTHIPCPSCGSSRSVLALFNGDFLQAFQWNPFGYIIALILIISPVWIAIDVITKKSSLLEIYLKTELLFRKKIIAITAIILVLVNWMWNIQKGV